MSKHLDSQRQDVDSPTEGSSRRQLLKVTAAGLIAGVATPLLSGQLTAIAAGRPASRVLIVYFSRTGNTREFANQIHQLVGGDLVEVRPVHPYPKDYRATTEQAKHEQEINFRPQISAEVKNMASYNTVFLGYPNWWGTMPMAMFTFLEKYNLSGKKLIPFCTHEGSRLGRSEADIRSKSPNATILDGLALRGGSSGTLHTEFARRSIAQWLAGLRITA